MRIDEKEYEIERLREDLRATSERLDAAKEIIEDFLEDIQWYHRVTEGLGIKRTKMKTRYPNLGEFSSVRTQRGDDDLLASWGFDTTVSRIRKVFMTPMPDIKAEGDFFCPRVAVEIEGRKKTDSSSSHVVSIEKREAYMAGFRAGVEAAREEKE